MRYRLTFCLFVVLAGAAAAVDLGPQAPVKPVDSSAYVAPDEVRQGGDTIATAVPITSLGTWYGTTIGYADDYDESCPWSATAPDVVYALTPDVDLVVDIDLCHSDYDTKLYVWDENLNVVGCSDDFHYSAPCGAYTSKIESLALQAGITLYIIIDGYGSNAGNYQLDITEFAPCDLACPDGAQLENEPPLVDGYVDSYNSGCGNLGTPVFQPITAQVFCGIAGWYLGDGGSQYRDTDWFHVVVPSGGQLVIVGDAEFATYMYELAPQDCATMDVVQYVTIGPCEESTLTIAGEPGSLVWLWIGSTTFSGPVYEYDYVLSLNLDGPVATDTETWSGVKALFR
ncbi:MAG: hypothetical protein RBT60_05895 [Candidatus Krumholzibacteria bacterium]|jgi:hypothetical protein|nr:hypothetical protein [Candidatus Krumholzibacteria bacterium]